MKGKSALLVGASGLVGGYCLRAILDSDRYSKVDILVRKQLPLKHEKLEQHLINFDYLERFSSVIKGDDVYCCLGSTMKKAGSREAFRTVDFGYPYEIAKIAVENGAKQFLIVTAIGSSTKVPVFYSRVKGDVEEAISKVGFGGVHIFRPSFLLGDRKEKRPLEDFLIGLGRATTFSMVGSFRRYRPIKGEVIAGAMVYIAGQESSGVTIYESEQIQEIYNMKLVPK